MRRKTSFLSLVLALCVGAPLLALAQANAPAELNMVKKGVFSLKEGQSMDLTDRGILLHLRRVRGQQGEKPEAVEYAVNGQTWSQNIGARLDMKTAHQTRDFLKDIRNCVLDVVSASLPVGAPASATFRLMCE